MKKRWLALLLAAALLMPQAGLCPAQAAPADEPDFCGYIVKLRDDVVMPFSEEDNAEALGLNMYLIDSAEDALALAASGMAEFVEPNYRLELYGAMDDLEDLRYLTGEQWDLDFMKVGPLWDLGLSGQGITVAVIDTGMIDSHEDKPIYTMPGYYVSLQQDEEGYYVSVQPGYTTDANGHGTFVSGVIAAKHNTTGVAGIAPNAKIMPLRVLDDNGYLYTACVAVAVQWAVDHGADVLNLSLGGPSYTNSLAAAVEYAAEQGAIVVAAVGNDGQYGSEKRVIVNYPAGYDQAIGVAAVSESGSVAYYSNINETVWVSAPGSSMYGLDIKGSTRYTTKSGTSFASPCVAALASLVKEYWRGHGLEDTFDYEDYMALLALTADDRGAAGYDIYYGHGTVNGQKLAGALPARSITYELNGGEPLEDPPEAYYIYQSGDVTLPQPRREGYLFNGWYPSSDFSGEAVSVLTPADTPWDREEGPTYYALWLEDGHLYDDGAVTLEPTCTEPGIMTYTCTKCSENSYTTAISPLGHTPEVVPGFAPTCTEPGVSDGSRCAVCDEVLVPSEAIPPLGHSYESVVNPATCTEGGAVVYTCSVCGDTNMVELPAGHESDEGAAVTEPTCTEPGVFAYTCTVCGEVLSETPIPAAGHQEVTELTAATCTEDGRIVQSCIVCGEVLSTTPITATGHQAVTTPGQAATCTDPGTTDEIKCSVCGEILIPSAAVPALGHSYSKGVCTRCGQKDPNYRPSSGGSSSSSSSSSRSKAPAPAPESPPPEPETLPVADGKAALKLEKDGELTDAQTKLITKTNAQAQVTLTTDKGLTVILPPGTLRSDSDVAALLPDMFPARTGDVVVRRDSDGALHPVILSLVDEGHVVFVADQPGTYEIVRGAAGFDDVADEHWALRDIRFAQSRGLMTGMTNTEFQPQVSPNRAMVFTVLARLSEAEVPAAPGSPWYAGNMAWAMEQGLTDGDRPLAPIRREELVTLLWRYVGRPRPRQHLAEAFPDAAFIDAWAVDAMNWAVENGILSGHANGTLDPDSGATRAELAKLLHTFVSYLVESRYIPFDEAGS